MSGNFYTPPVDGHERQEAEPLPTREMPFEQVYVNGASPNFPGGHFTTIGYKDKDFIVAKFGPNNNSTLNLSPNEPGAREQLLEEGYAYGGDADYGVSFADAEEGERSILGVDGQSQIAVDWTEVDRRHTYNHAARNNGLKDLDWEALSDAQKAQLKLIGYQGSRIRNTALISGQENQFTVSEGMRVTEDIDGRAEQIGTFAVINLADTNPSLNSNGNTPELPAFAFTDQAGNQVIAPASDTLADLLIQLGYRELETPAFETDIYAQAKATPSRPVAGDFTRSVFDNAIKLHRRRAA